MSERGMKLVERGSCLIYDAALPNPIFLFSYNFLIYLIIPVFVLQEETHCICGSS